MGEALSCCAETLISNDIALTVDRVLPLDRRNYLKPLGYAVPATEGILSCASISWTTPYALCIMLPPQARFVLLYRIEAHRSPPAVVWLLGSAVHLLTVLKSVRMGSCL